MLYVIVWSYVGLHEELPWGPCGQVKRIISLAHTHHGRGHLFRRMRRIYGAHWLIPWVFCMCDHTVVYSGQGRAQLVKDRDELLAKLQIV